MRRRHSVENCVCRLGPNGGSIFNKFSEHADGARRRLDRIGRGHRKGLGEARLRGTVRIDAQALGVRRRHAPRRRARKKNALGPNGVTFSRQHAPARPTTQVAGQPMPTGPLAPHPAATHGRRAAVPRSSGLHADSMSALSRHRRRHVYCAAMDVPVLKMTASARRSF